MKIGEDFCPKCYSRLVSQVKGTNRRVLNVVYCPQCGWIKGGENSKSTRTA